MFVSVAVPPHAPWIILKVQDTCRLITLLVHAPHLAWSEATPWIQRLLPHLHQLLSALSVHPKFFCSGVSSLWNDCEGLSEEGADHARPHS